MVDFMMRGIYISIQFIKKYRLETFLGLYFISFFFLLIGFNQGSILKSLYDAAALFALDIRAPSQDINVWWEYSLYLLALLAGAYTVLTVIELFVRDTMKERLRNSIVENGNHIIVLGLGESNRVYVESELHRSEDNMIIIEKDRNNVHIESYLSHDNISILVADATEKSVLSTSGIKDCKHVVISTGSDMVNLEIAVQLLEIKDDIKLFVHFEDRNLRHFHKENGILSGKNIKVYSYHEESARELFEVHDIDGTSNDIIQSSKSYAIAVVGNTSLAYEVIAQACIMGQLPNENKLTIYCIDKNIANFKESVDLQFTEIAQVPNVTLEYIELNPDTKSFYIDELWHTEMTNIIICFEDDQTNLDIASNLTDLTFLDKVVDGEMKTNILIAMFNGYVLSKKIKDNHNMFKHLHVFGSIGDVNDEKYVIAGERDKQAIATNFIYNNIAPKLIEYETYKYEYYTWDEIGYGGTGFVKTTEDKWAELSYLKKESNRAVADHMKMKLKYLGLQIVPKKENKTIESLFNANSKLFHTHLNDRLLLAKMEHNRWNTFHYLNGFRVIEFVSKDEKKEFENIHEAKKTHMCLVEFDLFKEKGSELEDLGYEKGQFEGYDFMINEHIPLIMANAGYGIVEK